MTVANDLIFLSLRNSGVNGVGQTPLSEDVNDSFKVLNAWINEQNLERRVTVNRITLPVFPDLVTDVSFWTPYEHVLLTTMAVRLRQIYAMPPVDLDVQLAISALKAFNAINQQQVAPVHPGTPTIVQQAIFMALRLAGRVTDEQSVADDSKEASDALSLFGMMVAQWQRQRWLNWTANPLTIAMTDPLDVPPEALEALVANLAARIVIASGGQLSEPLAAQAQASLNTLRNQQMALPLDGGGPITTAQQIIFLALRMAGRITDVQTVADNSKDVGDAFNLLVMMLGQWQRKRWLVWNEQEISVVATGNNYYTIGTGQDFDTPRPDKIHAAWCRLQPFGGPNPVDISLSIIEAKEDWATITIKDLKSIPAAVFYDSSFPVGRVYFWPVPNGGHYEMHLVVKATLPVPATITATMDLPPEYLDAVVNNLACRIIVASGGQISPFLLGQAKASLETIKMANSQIPLLGMPAALSGRRGGDVSSWSGRGLDRAWIVGSEAVL